MTMLIRLISNKKSIRNKKSQTDQVSGSHASRSSFRIALTLLHLSAVALLFLIHNGHAANQSNSANLARPIVEKPSKTNISSNAKLRSVVVKFVDGSAVRQPLGRGGAQLVSMSNMSLTAVDATLKDYISKGSVSPLISVNPVQLDARRKRLEQKSGLKLADLGNYFEIKVSSVAEAMSLIDELNKLDIVEVAYAQPEAEPAVFSTSSLTTSFSTTAAPNFDAQQTYLRAAPGGVDADFASTVPGGDGTGVKVIDVEGGWRTSHEDLSSNPPFVQLGGQFGSLDWRNHGTAVIGEILGSDNGSGIKGIAPGVQWGYSSIASQSTASALQNAGNNLSVGDLILIELHAPGPHFGFESRDDQLGYVCMEYFIANFDVIQQLFIDGIVVCEAAGNGAEDYDDQSIYGVLFDTTSRNSHAIICGAGAPSTNLHGPDRSRLGFSNHGERVNLQGDGRGVATTGYGGLFNGGTEDTWYTSTFSGTSSASPIVTGSVAALQGAHKNAFAIALNSDEIRTILNSTGTPQTGNVGQHIGPRPNLQAAFDLVLGVAFTADTTIGMAPLAVQFTGLSSKTVTNWLWGFGDGDSSLSQSPSHTYPAGGVYDVSLAIESVEGPFSTSRSQYVVALADTIIGLDTIAASGGTVRVDVYARNILPVFQVKIPVDWAGPMNLALDSASVNTLRSSGMTLDQVSINPFTDQSTYTLTASSTALGSYLQPGTGPILSVFFSIPGNVSAPSNTISFDGFSSDQPTFVTDLITFRPMIENATVSLCLKAGDANNNGSVNIADVTMLIAMIFTGGPLPSPFALGDADCNGSVNIADVTFLINMIFSGGPLPCDCAL